MTAQSRAAALSAMLLATAIDVTPAVAAETPVLSGAFPPSSEERSAKTPPSPRDDVGGAVDAVNAGASKVKPT